MVRPSIIDICDCGSGNAGASWNGWAPSGIGEVAVLVEQVKTGAGTETAGNKYKYNFGYDTTWFRHLTET